MAPQKQAKRNRQAVSVKKKASHGGSRSRAASPLTVPAPAARAGLGAAKAGASAASAGAATSDEVAASGRGSVIGWVRSHPLQLATWVLSLCGLGVSIYLTITHYDTSVVIACSDKGLVNCAKVTSSAQSMVFNIFPVAVLGLAFYVFMAAINSPLGWRWDRREVKWLRLGSVVVGMGFVIYLIYAELIQIGNICLFCTSVHVVTFFLFALIVYEATSWGSTATGSAATGSTAARR